jgi:hypothetical protein
MIEKTFFWIERCEGRAFGCWEGFMFGMVRIAKELRALAEAATV